MSNEQRAKNDIRNTDFGLRNRKWQEDGNPQLRVPGKIADLRNTEDKAWIAEQQFLAYLKGTK